jgi:tRNA(fMet)-specific endonuclease VapC
MPLCLLDTNFVSDLIKDPRGRVAGKIAEIGESAVATSVIVAAKLRFGAVKRGSPRLTAQVDAVLGAMNVLPLQTPADFVSGRVRAALEQKGQKIGANDLLIAAQALMLSCILVTGTVSEFERVETLVVENWLGS